MTFSLRQLQVVRAVIETGTVTDAASALGISQPAVSMALRDCNRDAGFSLFARKQGRLQPTHETLALVPEINRVLDGLDRIRELVDGLRDINVGLIRVAAAATLADNLVAKAIAKLRTQRAAIDVSLFTANNAEVAEHVSAGRVDFGLVLAPVDVLDTQPVDLIRSELVCVVAPDHPLAKRKSVEPKDLTDYPLISFSRGLAMGALIEQAFQKKRVRRRVSLEISQSSTARALARARLGVAIVDSFYLLADREQHLTTLKFVPRTMQVAQLLLPRDGRLSRPARLLMNAIKETALSLEKRQAG